MPGAFPSRPGSRHHQPRPASSPHSDVPTPFFPFPPYRQDEPVRRMPHRFVLLMLLGLALMAGSMASRSALADPFATAVDGLAVKGFSKLGRAAETLAGTGDPRAAAVLEALADSRLYRRKADNRIVIIDKASGGVRLRDPLQNAEPETVDAKTFRKQYAKLKTNNRLRGMLKTLLGGLGLLDPDPATRIASARVIFEKPTADQLPLVEKALGTETDSGVKAQLALARSAILVRAGETPASRISAIEALAGTTSQEVRSLLGSVLANDTETDEAVRAAAREALVTIDERLQMLGLIQNLFQGISLGSVLLLAAIGLAITFGVMGVINMAHGEMVMLGAYATYLVQEGFRLYAPELFGWSLLLAVPAAFLLSGGVGVAVERGIIRYLYGRPLETLLATWGLSLILQQAVRTLFGPTNREVGSPEWMSGAVEITSGLVLTTNRIWIVLFALLVLFALMAVLRYTPFGLQMRAVTQNRRMANAMGIRSGWIDALTFGLGSGIAGMAGVALSQIDNVSPNLGQSYIIDSFMVVVFGGVGNLWGTLVGALSLGVVNKFLEPYAGAVLGKIIVLIAIILFIQKRPRGLFALKGRAVES